MYVATPPNYQNLLAHLDAKRLVELLQQGLPSDGRDYVHWDKLRQLKPPAKLSHEEWWSLIKLGRKPVERAIPLTDPSGAPFVYSVPDLVARRLHYVDQRCSREVAISEVVTTDEQARQHYLVNSLMEEAIR